MTFVMLAAGIVSTWLLVHVLRLKGRVAILPIASLFGGISIWAFGTVFELEANDLNLKLLSAKIEYFGIVLLAGAWLVFSLAYTGRRRYISKRFIAVLSVVPALTLAIVWTNEFHHLHWISYTVEPRSNAAVLAFDHGPWFWIHSAYSYALLVLGMALILAEALRLPAPLRGQGVLLVVAIAAPSIVTLLQILNVFSFIQADAAPVMSLVSFSVLIVAIKRFRLLYVAPIGREVALKNLRDGMIVIDEGGVIVNMNAAVERITGVGLKVAILKNVRDIFRDFDVLPEELLSDETDQPDPIVGNDGGFYDRVVVPIDDGSGGVVGNLVVLRDISDRVQADSQAAEARNRYISMISHELRSPLTVISAFASLVASNKDDNLQPEQLERIAMIQRSSRILDALIDDLSDMSKAGSGKLSIEPVEFGVNEAIDEVIQSTKPLWHAKDQNLRVDTFTQELLIRADQLRFIQIVTNLVSNASKYSPDNTQITLTASVESDGLSITVQDQGIGISRADLSQMFTPFFRATNPETRSERGTGLGLFIVKSLVELHGGQIEIDSEIGQGTSISFWLPGLVDMESRRPDVQNQIDSDTEGSAA